MSTLTHSQAKRLATVYGLYVQIRIVDLDGRDDYRYAHTASRALMLIQEELNIELVPSDALSKKVARLRKIRDEMA